MKLKRHFEDRNGIQKAPPPAQQGRGRGRSRTAGKSDFDESRVSRNDAHGHPREERRSQRFDR